MNEAGVVLRDLELLARFAVAFATQDPRAFEADGDTLTMDLSPVAAKLFTPLLRRRIVPIVATMVDGVCAECNVAVPTGLASSIMASRELHICLRCKRILIPLEAVQAAARRADGSAP
jgi:predicted  nucleic acid-binding Zn-ribbon protein